MGKVKAKKKRSVKKIISLIIAAAIIITGIVLIIVVSNREDSLSRLMPKVSEFRSNIFVGENDNFNISATAGFRETNFNIDGVSNDTQEFAIITITPKSGGGVLVDSSFSALIDGKAFSSNFTAHPFNGSFEAEFNVAVVETISLTLPTNNETPLQLTPLRSEQMITGERALEIAEKHLAESIKVLQNNFEIFVRLIENPIDGSGGVHWHISFVGTDLRVASALICPVSVEVVSSRTIGN